MASFPTISALIFVLLLYKYGISSCNKCDAQLSRTQKELLKLQGYISNLQKYLHEERIEEKRGNGLNLTISHPTQKSQNNDHPQCCRLDFNGNMGFGRDILGYLDLKKTENLQRGFEREKTLRIMAEKRVDALEKKLQLFEDDLKAQKGMAIAFQNRCAHAEDTGEKIGNFDSRVKTVEKDVENIRTKVMARSKQVAFLGRLTSTLTSFRIGQKIVFDDIYVNLGNWYQTSTGVFTAPVAGLYIVLLAISSDQNSTPNVEIVRNGETLCRTVMAVLNSWSVVPCTVVVHLSQGDQIWAQVFSLYHPSHTIRGKLFSSFSIGLFSTD